MEVDLVEGGPRSRVDLGDVQELDHGIRREGWLVSTGECKLLMPKPGVKAPSNEFPGEADGYIRLADQLSWRLPGDSRPVQLDRAIAILERALARPVGRDQVSWVKSRLRDLREQKKV